jgi:hypothetical protein
VQLLSLNLSRIDSTRSPYNVLYDNVPFAGDDKGNAFVSFMDPEGTITVFSGDCHAPADAARIWTFHPGNSSTIGNGTWSSASVGISPATQDSGPVGPLYLAGGFSFATSNDTAPSYYTFGGLCPFANSSTTEDWMSAANYSRTMASLDPSPSSPSGNYDIGLTASPNPPVAEAGLTITPLQGTTSTTPTGKLLQQGDFLFIGGHTQTAFINMSSLALFSLPQGGWTYIPVDAMPHSRTDLAVRDAQVEPRSGHTAVTSSDGSKIIVLGGWVGDTSTPADPQLVILEVGEDYGGSGPWSWSIPSLPTGSGLPQGSGIFGHAAVMLPGDVMAVFGGYNISSQSATSKRSSSDLQPNSQVHLYNVTSNSWRTSYTNPGPQPTTANKSESGPMSSTGEKAGLGIGLSAAAVAVFGVAYCFWSRKRNNHRRSRDQELRKLALGAERSPLWTEPGMAASFHAPMNDTQPPDLRSSIINGVYLPSPNHQYRVVSNQQYAAAEAERSGLLIEVPSPTRGLRKNLSNRPQRFQSAGWYDESRQNYGAGFIHPIDEREEYETPPESLEPTNSEHGSPKHSAPADPFVDPSPSRSPLGSYHEDTLRAQHNESEDIDDASAHSPGSRSASPDKSERTHSDLSESSVSGLSVSSIQRSNFGSARRGPHLFRSGIPNLEPSSARFGSSSPSGRESPPKNNTNQSDSYRVKFVSSSGDVRMPFERSATADSFSTAPTSLRQSQWEGESLMEAGSEWATPPESPTKLSTTMTESKRNSLTWMGSIRKTLSGAKKAASLLGPGVQDSNNTSSPPPRSSSSPEHRASPSPGRRPSTASTVHMRRKQGPRDWGAVADKRRSGHSLMSLSPADAMTAEELDDDDNNNKHHHRNDDDEYDDWDVEAAAENRVVQVTYTIPKEKLRVVNAGIGDDHDDDNEDDVGPSSNRADRAPIVSGK